MSDIEELERRITAALDRVGQAMERLAAPSDAPGEDLSDALDAERTANAQLEERVRAIKEKQETMVTGLEAEVARLRDAVERRDGEVQALRAANVALRENNTALREAVTTATPDADAVTASFAGELEALHADRAAEAAEMTEILAALAPVLEEEDARA